MAFQLIDDASLSAIVQNVAAMVSYPVPNDPAGDTDPAVQQFTQAANLAASDLLIMHAWQEMVRPHTITITADTPGQAEKAFDLPVDFQEFVDQTQWNSTMQWPAIGPVSAQAWQQLLVRQTLPTLSFYWQVRDNKIYILSPPTSAQDLTFYYQSKAWVRDQDDTSLYKNRLVKNGDICLIEPYLVTLLARVKWLEMKGLDSSAAMRDFQVSFENRKGNERGAAVLNMAMQHRFPYLNPIQNLPDTGIGV